MHREAASHHDRQHRLVHALELRVKELESDCVQLLYERDKARELACHYEEIIAEYKRIEPLRFGKADIPFLDPYRHG